MQFSSECKYLGVELNGKLSWKSHLERRFVSSEATGIFGLVWIYKAILKPRLTYAELIWGKRISKKTSEAVLEKLRDTNLCSRSTFELRTLT